MRTRTLFSAACTVVASAAILAGAAMAASHREAPAMTLDPGADISDFYSFVGYDQANLSRQPADRKVTFIMNVVPSQEPSSGPNYFAFDDDVLYVIHLDNDRDGEEDLSYEFRFSTQTVSPDQFLATLALPPVTSLEGAGSEGLALKQRYTVTEVRDCRGKRGCLPRVQLFKDRVLSAVPSNIGSRTTPDYASLAAQGIFSDMGPGGTGIRVFAGQRAETFAIDLGAVFDTLNLRVETSPRPINGLPVHTAAEDANDTVNAFGANAFSGFNVNTIAIEIPIRRVTRDGMPASAANALIGSYAATFRQRITLRRDADALDNPGAGSKLQQTLGGWKQVSRMGNPLINELIIPVGLKDLWNATEADGETAFLQFYRDLAVAGALQLVSGVPVPPTPRNDVVALLTQYPGQNVNVGPYADLLRLDLTVPPTPPAQIKRLTILAHDAAGNPTPDAAGFPNGRRPNDDVTDLVVRVAGGTNFIVNYVGDGVGINEKGITAEFPFLPTPFDGRDRQHKDPGESMQ